MYVGRIVAVGLTDDNSLSAMYRVSSRSFPNRVIKKINGALAVLPEKGFESDIYKNPFISYNCLRCNARYAVVGNGIHTDPMFDKLETGLSMRDCLTSVLFGMDYEHDDLNTPRIAAIVDKETKLVGLGVVRDNGIEVSVFKLETGSYRYLATYEHCHVNREYGGRGFEISNANDAAEFLFKKGVFEHFQKPISSVAAYETENGFDLSNSFS